MLRNHHSYLTPRSEPRSERLFGFRIFHFLGTTEWRNACPNLHCWGVPRSLRPCWLRPPSHNTRSSTTVTWPSMALARVMNRGIPTARKRTTWLGAVGAPGADGMTATTGIACARATCATTVRHTSRSAALARLGHRRTSRTTERRPQGRLFYSPHRGVWRSLNAAPNGRPAEPPGMPAVSLGSRKPYPRFVCRCSGPSQS